MPDEGPSTLPWAEKVRRVADILQDLHTSWFRREDIERDAERILTAIGDANV